MPIAIVYKRFRGGGGGNRAVSCFGRYHRKCHYFFCVPTTQMEISSIVSIPDQIIACIQRLFDQPTFQGFGKATRDECILPLPTYADCRIIQILTETTVAPIESWGCGNNIRSNNENAPPLQYAQGICYSPSYLNKDKVDFLVLRDQLSQRLDMLRCSWLKATPDDIQLAFPSQWTLSNFDVVNSSTTSLDMGAPRKSYSHTFLLNLSLGKFVEVDTLIRCLIEKAGLTGAVRCHNTWRKQESQPGYKHCRDKVWMCIPNDSMDYVCKFFQITVN